MSKIAQAFDHGKAFIPFVTAGDPDLETTKELLLVLQESGADLIEIGIPFSDPVAEGIVIQKADERALAAGTTTDKIFDMVESIQDKMHVPMVFMTYANVIFVYGIEKFAKRSKEIGMSGVIIPGFVYCVSSLGVTGMRSTINKGVAQMIEQVKKTKDIPCAIGFGISTPEQAKEMSEFSDGVIVGSAIVKLVETYGKECIKPVSEYVKSMKEAIS